MRRHFLITLTFLVLVITAIAFNGVVMEPVQASMRTITEAPGQILYQSREGLRDQNGQPWQIVLFKRTQAGKNPIINLRLVGFPEMAIFNHPAPLVIANNQQELMAEDIFAAASPASNVGQYDLHNVFNQLSADSFWELVLPLNGAKDEKVTIKIPYFLIQEWQRIANS